MSTGNCPAIVKVVPHCTLREVNPLGNGPVFRYGSHHEGRSEHILGTDAIDIAVLREIHCKRPHYGIVVKCHTTGERVDIRHEAIAETGIISH